MIRGRFGNTSGRPHIEGRIFLPRIGVRGDISFLFDTGADESLLMPLDGLRMGIDYANLPDQASSSGIGGDYENFIEPAILIFAGDNEKTISTPRGRAAKAVHSGWTSFPNISSSCGYPVDALPRIW